MRATRILLIILAIFIVLPFIGRFFWVLQKGRKMEIMIVNKTVPKDSHNEVKSLTWVLNYNKILKTDNARYNFEKDYYGYHPDAPAEEWKIRSFRIADLPSICDKYSALIFLDNQGVKLVGNRPNLSPNFYGGFNQNDYLLLKNMMEAGKLIVAEYNFFSDPTEDLVRYNTEQMLDIHCLGWRGKFFSNLSAEKITEELEPKWIDRYTSINGQDWAFQGPGLVLINVKQNRIIVLPRDEFMEKDYPDVVTKKDYASSRKLPEKNAFSSWFAIVYQGENEVISNINLNLNEKGRSVMMSNGLECSFPAVIKSTQHPFYFIAGDFSKEDVSLALSRVRIINDIFRMIEGNMTENPKMFFHTFYVPFMSSIFAEYDREMNTTGV